MDPYLEDPGIWMDFHQSFITYLRDFLNDRLFAFTYDRGRYRRKLKYSGAPQVALSQEDLQWVTGLAKA
jgi:hypothetical protein